MWVFRECWETTSFIFFSYELHFQVSVNKNGVSGDNDRNGCDGDFVKQSTLCVGVDHIESRTDEVAADTGKEEIEGELSEEGEIDDLEEGELKSDEDSVTGSMHSNEKSTRRSVSFIFFMHYSSISKLFCNICSSMKGLTSYVRYCYF